MAKHASGLPRASPKNTWKTNCPFGHAPLLRTSRRLFFSSAQIQVNQHTPAAARRMTRRAVPVQPAPEYPLAVSCVAHVDMSVCCATNQQQMRFRGVREIVTRLHVCLKHTRSPIRQNILTLEHPYAKGYEDKRKRASAGGRGNRIVALRCFHAGFVPDSCRTSRVEAIKYLLQSGESQTCVALSLLLLGRLLCLPGESENQSPTVIKQ